jgi:Heterokaryon incompatibility protein (HET)
MSERGDDDEDFEVITDKDFAKYPLQRPRHLWKPLNGDRQVRLLKIFPTVKDEGLPEDTIECRLETWDLDSAKGRYDALSYAWGAEGNGFEYIQCDNITKKIWRNLHQALIQLRRKISSKATRQTKLIWVDALCIDQTDMLERQNQIGLMKDIFGFAAQVLIWLGEHDEVSRQVWKSTEGAEPGSVTETLRNLFQWNMSMRESFVRRPWFHRVWTLQEVVLSRKATMLCGEGELDWATFCTIWKDRYHFMMNLKPEFRQERVDHIEKNISFTGLLQCFDIQQQIWQKNGETNMSLPLSEIIIRTWYRFATEDYDRIYAIIGLIDVAKYPLLRTPDYSGSILEFFVAVTKLAIQVDQTPALLNLAGLSPDDVKSIEDENSLSTATQAVEGKVEAGESSSPASNQNSPEKAGAVSRSTRRPSWVPDWKQKGYENSWLFRQLESDDSDARIHANPEKTGGHWYASRDAAERVWEPRFDENRLHILGHFVGYLPTRYGNPGNFTMTAISDGNAYDLHWVGENPIKDGEEYTIERAGMPYYGTTARDADVVCVFEGIRTLFLVRMMFEFPWSIWGAMEFLKEDTQYKGLKFNCYLVGPVQIEGLELKENPSLGRGSNHWQFIVH